MLTGKVTLACCASLVMALFSMAAQATVDSPGVCDIQVDKQLSVYQVLVGEEVYRGKGYLTYQDALALRAVLLSSGICEKIAAPKSCVIKTLAAFDFAVFREGMNFDRYAKLRTLEQARDYAQALVKTKLCVMKDG